MSTSGLAGRGVGVLLVLQLAGGLILPYVLLAPVLAAPGFLANAAQHPANLRAAVFLFLFGAAITLGISIAAYPVLRHHSRGLALCLIALATANAPLQAVESAMVLSMLSLSHQSAMAGAADGTTLQIVANALGSTRTWVHYTQLVTVVSWIVVLYVALWRAAIIPSLLAVTGLITSGLQLGGVPLPALLGYRIVPEMAMPLAPAYLWLAGWLIVKGFAVRRPAA